MSHNHESNLRNIGWLINCSYNPQKHIMICNHLDKHSKYFNLYFSNYERIMLLGNDKNQVQGFCDIYIFECLIKHRSCYKIQLSRHVLI